MFHPILLFKLCVFLVGSIFHPTLLYVVCFITPYCLQYVSPYHTVCRMVYPTILLAVCFTTPYCLQYVIHILLLAVCFTLPNCLQHISLYLTVFSICLTHPTVCIYFITPKLTPTFPADRGLVSVVRLCHQVMQFLPTLSFNKDYSDFAGQSLS